MKIKVKSGILLEKEKNMINPKTVKRAYVVGPESCLPEMTRYAHRFTGRKNIEIIQVLTDSIRIKDEKSPFEELGPLMNRFESRDPNYFVLISTKDQAGRVFATLCENRHFEDFGKHYGQWSLHQFAANAIVDPNT